MTKNPKISIVLPCYNGSKMLGDAIESIIAQTYNDWELIIVNDCSTDNSLEIAEQFAAKDERIRVFSNEVNSKLPKSLNNGFSKARGMYWTWTSDDNLLLPDFCEEMNRYLDEHPEVGFVVGGENIIDQEGTVLRTDLPPQDIQDRIALNNFVGACFMYRKEVAERAGEYRPDLFLVEDYEYWIRLSGVTRIGTISSVLYLYRKHDKSLTATRQLEIQKMLVHMRLMYKDQIEQQILKKPQLLTLFYYRIVDGLSGWQKWKYIKEFSIKLPYYFGVRYFFVHIPHQMMKKCKQ